MCIRLLISFVFLLSVFCDPCAIDESKNILGAHRCIHRSQCLGERVCSYWGFCTGDSHCDVKTTPPPASTDPPASSPSPASPASPDTTVTKHKKMPVKIPIKIPVNKSVKRQIRRENDRNERLIKRLEKLEKKIHKERAMLKRKQSKRLKELADNKISLHKRSTG